MKQYRVIFRLCIRATGEYIEPGVIDELECISESDKQILIDKRRIKLIEPLPIGKGKQSEEEVE